MNFRSNNSNKNNSNKIFIIIVFVVIIAIIIFSKFGKGTNLFSKLTNQMDKSENFIVVSFNNFMDGLKTKKGLQEKIKELEEKNKKLEYDILEMQKIESENKSLRQKLEIAEEYKHFKLVYGSVTVRDFDNWNDSFMINVGTKQGIKEGMPVVSKEGVVGFISSISEDTSKVITILDPSSSVSVEISSINRPAVCKGDYAYKGTNKLKLTYIPIDAEISPGDTIYTSGIGVMYPKGLPLGRVVEIKNKKNDINRYAIVETFSNIDSLNDVAVIVN